MTESAAFGEGYKLGGQEAVIATLKHIHANLPPRDARAWVLKQLRRVEMEAERDAKQPS